MTALLRRLRCALGLHPRAACWSLYEDQGAVRGAPQYVRGPVRCLRCGRVLR